MANQKIHLRGQFERIELVAATIIKPGMLVTMTPTAKTCGYHSTSAGFGERLIAQEDSLQGNTVDTSYAIGDVVSLNAVFPGAMCLLRLKAGYSYALGQHLMSNGDGTFIGQSSAKQEFAVVLDATDLSASGAVDTLVRCRMM